MNGGPEDFVLLAEPIKPLDDSQIFDVYFSEGYP